MIALRRSRVLPSRGFLGWLAIVPFHILSILSVCMFAQDPVIACIVLTLSVVLLAYSTFWFRVFQENSQDEGLEPVRFGIAVTIFPVYLSVLPVVEDQWGSSGGFITMLGTIFLTVAMYLVAMWIEKILDAS